MKQVESIELPFLLADPKPLSPKLFKRKDLDAKAEPPAGSAHVGTLVSPSHGFWGHAGAHLSFGLVGEVTVVGERGGWTFAILVG